MATDDGKSLDGRGREKFRQLKALSASIAARGSGSLAPEVLACYLSLGGGRTQKFGILKRISVHSVTATEFSKVSFFGVVRFGGGGGEGRVRGVKVVRCPRT